MKRILGAAAVCSMLLSTETFAQQHRHKCGATDIEKAMEVAHPGYLQAVKTAFLNAKQNAAFREAQRSNTPDTVYRIRTVVHVVYTKPEENLDDSIILSQIDVLNEDYRRRNADTVNTRSVFQEFAADAGIEFFLADTDPDGNPTTGITHTQGSPPPSIFGGFGANDEVKSQSTGGVNAWPTDRYFNIWVCDIMGGLGVLGYAYPPAAPLPNWGSQNPNADSSKQGVVLYYKAVGRNNPYAIDSTVNGGRSATHEAGHYFGLRHIWGDDQSFLGPGNKCAGDQGGGEDGIDDTPDAKDASQQTCDTTKNTCPDPNMLQDYPDMVENYMDYSSDDCLNMFTNGQVALMREVIRLYRPGIAEKVPNVAASIKQVRYAADVKISPNPAKNEIWVEVPANESNVSIQILSVEGKLVQTVQTSIARTNINVAGLQQGVYFLAVGNSNFSTVKRIVIAE